MVKLTRIYTRSGDEGNTSLGDGQRVEKTAHRVTAYGTVDEANACIGLAVVAAEQAAGAVTHASDLAGVLREIQHDMFDVGADLATPVADGEQPDQRLRVQPHQTDRLEAAIDHYNSELGELSSFVLPGGTPLAAALHLARTVVRRAERECVALRHEEGMDAVAEPVRYLNRLSDLLFVLARVANHGGSSDLLWKPGKGRHASLVPEPN